jgi:hypothetical protein
VLEGGGAIENLDRSAREFLNFLSRITADYSIEKPPRIP